jgi:CysZ protein
MPEKNRSSLGVIHGLRTVPRALELLRELPSVLRLLLIPLALTAVLDGLAFYYGFGWLRGRIAAAVPDQGAWHAVRGVLGFLSGALVLLLLAWTFSFVYLALCELVVDSVSEAVEQRVTGHHGNTAGVRSKLRSLGQSLAQAVLLWGVGLFTLLLGLIPVVGPVVALIGSAIVLGYGFFSISAGRKAQTLGERWQLARRELGAVLGLGLVAFLVNLVPVVNLLALPVFVVAGTLLYLDTTAAP